MGEKKLAAYMTLDEAADYCGIPVSTLYKKVNAKLLKAFKPGKRILLKREDIDNFIKGFAV